MHAFSSRPSPKIIFGEGAITELPECVRAAGGSNVLIVTDPGVAGAGHITRAAELLEAEGIRFTVYDQAHENPSESDAERCRAFAEPLNVDCIVGLGGGSSMDTAKACNYLLTHGGRMRDYKGYGHASRPMLPLIAIPTTAGTGSECQSYALVSRDDTREKMACGDPQLLARAAILDPELTASVPRMVGILTAIDALSHALETAVSTRSNPISTVYSEASFRRLSMSIARAATGTTSAEDRGNMLLGAAKAGLAIENSMLGAAHATANPLSARYGLLHGHAIALTLPSVMKFNYNHEDAAVAYRHLGMQLKRVGFSELSLIDWVEHIIDAAQLPEVPLPAGVDEAIIKQLAADASQQWTGRFNPRPLLNGDLESLYRDILK